MPWNVVDKLEQICINYNKKNISEITYKELEAIIIRRLGVTREATIDRYVKILLKLKWINKQGNKIIILYDKNNMELF